MNLKAWPGWLLATVALIVLIAVAAGGAAGSRMLAEPAASTPDISSVDAGFLRDMQTHHAQAVDMSITVRERTSDEEIRTLALDIEMGQQHQIGQMYGWLADWGLPQTTTGPPMAWMRNRDANAAEPHAPDHAAGAPGAGMPGMASAADIRRLRDLRGQDAERLYLQLMIPHHRAGVEMAKYAAEYASEPLVRKLAQSMVDAQSAEVLALQDMLESRGGELPR